MNELTDKPASAYSVREATVDDAAALAAIRRALFDELGKPATVAQTLECERLSETMFKEGIEQRTTYAWFAESPGGELVASTVLVIFPRLPSPQLLATTEGYLLNVYTRPDWRRRGIAASLLQHAIARSRELGLGRIRLHATDDGQPLYTSFGFRVRPDAMELRFG